MSMTLVDWVEQKEKVSSKESPWLLEYCAKAESLFRKIGLPNPKMESWKYINTRDFLDREYLFESSGDFDLKDLLPTNTSEQRLVFVDGILNEKESKIFENDKIKLSSLRSINCKKIQEKMRASLEKEENPLALLNAARFREAYVVEIEKNVFLEKDLHLYFISDSKSMAHMAKTVLNFGYGSKAKIASHFIGAQDQDSLLNEFCEIYVEENAKVDWVNIQKLNSANRLFSTFRACLEKGSELKKISFSNQGEIIRNDEIIRHVGEQSSCSLKGLAFLRNTAQVFNEVSVHHHATHCKSEQVYKNILAGSSKAEFNSLAYVHRDAQKSDSMQLNKNLLLSDDARAYSRPKLMIYADDVVANHGSANGQLDKKELFYLLSRGFSKNMAQYVLTLGFAEDILQSIEIDSLRIELENYVKLKLEEIVN